MNELALEDILKRSNASAWEEINFTDKSSLRQADHFASPQDGVLHWFSSSGSTGEPVIYPWSSADEEVAIETVNAIHQKDVITPGTPALIVAPTGLPGMWYHMDRQLRHMNYATVFAGTGPPDVIFDLISKLKPGMLISLPLVLSRLGEYRLMNGLAGLPHDAVLFAGGDVLSAARKGRIENLWGVKTKNFYGLSEVFGPLAKEINGGPSMEWCADRVFVEIIDPVSKRGVLESETGVAVITTLWERPVALTRYWTGDFFKLLRWIDPGKPIFEMKGREKVRVPFLRSEYFPIDIDEIILADTECGNEWKVKVDGEKLCLDIETRNGSRGPSTAVVERLVELFDIEIEIRVVSPGALDRSVPKLCI